MILVSSSGDHLDCFLAGDSVRWAPVAEDLLDGTVAAIDSGVEFAVVEVATVAGTEAEREETGPDAVDCTSSSSLALRSSEISTLAEVDQREGNGC